MSWLSQAGKAIEKGVRDVGRELGRAAKKVAPVASFIPGLNVVSAVAGVASSLSRPKSGGTAMTLPTTAFPVLTQGAPNALIGGLAGPIARAAGAIGSGLVGGAVGDFIGSLTPGGTQTAGGCGCNGKSGRDSCTGQRMSSQPAPRATLFGGCCPPGRTLRRISLGRDVCIKTPRMNPFNPQALARADRRVTTFARRAAPILKDMGFTVSSTRRVKIAAKKKRR